jgi:hypothetical protein
MTVITRALPHRRQPQGAAGLNPAFARDLAFLVTPGFKNAVRYYKANWVYPSFTNDPLLTANPVVASASGRGVLVNGTNIGYQVQRLGTPTLDAYAEVPNGSDYTWIFQVDAVGYSGTNPGFYRNGNGYGVNFLLLPAGGLWLRQNGSDYTSSVAAPAAGNTVTVAVSVASAQSILAFVNGVKVLDATTTTATGNFTGTNGVNRFGSHTGTSQYISGNHTVGALLYRAYPAAVLKALSLNPNLLFKSMRRRWAVSSAALYPTLSNIRFSPATSTGGYFAVDLS